MQLLALGGAWWLSGTGADIGASPALAR